MKGTALEHNMFGQMASTSKNEIADEIFNTKQ